MVKLSFFQLRVMNVKLKNIKLRLKLLTGKLKKKNSLYFILYAIEIYTEIYTEIYIQKYTQKYIQKYIQKFCL